jgi:hypothetical protein
MRLPMRCLIAVCLLFPGTGRAQTEGTYLYEVSLLRAAPGRFADFIDAVRADSALSVEAGDAVPFVIRHSQGDHWDFLRITPIESFAAYHAPDRSARRARVWNGARGRALRARLDSVTAHREEWFAHSVAVDDLAERFRGMGLFHVEMFVGLAGRRTDLVEQRRMENRYYDELDRQLNVIFVRAGGSHWDAMTIGFYTDLQAFASAGAQHTMDEQESAARAAGFDGVDAIAPYLRSLLSRHHDTLGRVP